MTQVDFYDKEQVDDLLEGKADATSVGAETDQESETGSLWARVKYVLGHWMTRDTEQTVTGKKVFSGGAEVPTTPATATSAVNSVYVNDATDGVNNLVHKSGNETIAGIKTMTDAVSAVVSAIAYNRGSATEFIEIIRTSEDREIEMEIFSTGYNINLNATLFSSNWTISGGFAWSHESPNQNHSLFITRNSDNSVSLWFTSTSAFIAYLKHNKNWRNNYGFQSGLQMPNTITETDPRTTLSYKAIPVNKTVIQ